MTEGVGQLMKWTVLWQGHWVVGILWRHLPLTQVPKGQEARKKGADAVKEIQLLKAGNYGLLPTK